MSSKFAQKMSAYLSSVMTVLFAWIRAIKGFKRGQSELDLAKKWGR